MKSKDTSKKLPSSATEWAAVIAASPGKNRRPTAQEAVQWDDAVVVNGGGMKR